MELEESEIINLAVNIFQNVGIKRYIGDIEALKHQDIYFEIYKIIFPDSMINIFKISESSLTTGEKIQKIIQEISSIIKLDLYHISGEAIAQGNINHITNWLQLLQALSNNFIGHTYHGGGGSAPDRDIYIDREFSDYCYHTVIGMGGQFENPVYDDQNEGSSGEYSTSGARYEQEQQYPTSEGEKSSQQSGVLKPVQQPSKKNNNRKKVVKKKVTFNLNDNGQNRKKDNEKNTLRNSSGKSVGGNSTQATILNGNKKKNRTQKMDDRLTMYTKQWGMKKSKGNLQKQKKYIGKMYEVIEELEKKNIYDKNMEFQNWAYTANQNSNYDRMRIEAENKQRVNLINMKIIQRQQLLNTISGQQQAIAAMKQIFRDQKRTEKEIKRINQAKNRMELEQLLQPNFAYAVHNQILEAFAE